MLIGLACVAVFSLFSQARTGTIQTRDEINAAGYAASILNFARGLPFDHPFLAPLEKKKICELTGCPSDQKLCRIDPLFDCTLTVSQHDPDQTTCPYAYKVLRVDVNWVSGGVKRSIAQTSLHVGAAR